MGYSGLLPARHAARELQALWSESGACSVGRGQTTDDERLQTVLEHMGASPDMAGGRFLL
jgi:hypothetical protein